MRVKDVGAVLFSVLLLSMGFTGNHESFADAIQEEKIQIINELKELEDDIDKKSKKKINAAILKLENSLDEKFWKNESSLNFKHGKKVLNADFSAVNKLDKILENKKTTNDVKEKIIEINQRIASIDQILLDNAIMSLSEIIMSEKGLKKIDKAIIKFEKGNDFLEEGNYVKALNQYKNSWDQIKKALKDPHFKKLIVELEGTGRLNFDNSPDVYLKISKSIKDNKPKQIEMKITSECVNGLTHEDAQMKIGLSTPDPAPGVSSLEFFDEEFQATNKWFKQNDPDKRISPVVISTPAEYFSFPVSGDDLIQINTENNEESFSFVPEITELDNQSGWSGVFTIDAPPGDYLLHYWLPLTAPTSEGDSCNFVSSFSIDQEFE